MEQLPFFDFIEGFSCLSKNYFNELEKESKLANIFKSQMVTSVRQKFIDSIVPVCSREARDIHQSASISLGNLGYSADNFRDPGNKSPVWAILEEIVKQEGLELRVIWDHTDHGNKPCESDCRPVSLCIRWM